MCFQNVTLEDLTQPQPGTTDRTLALGPCEGTNHSEESDLIHERDNSYDDLHGPLEADGSLIDTRAPFHDSFEIANAFNMDDFALSNLRHVLWVPKPCLRLWNKVFANITGELIEAISSDGPTRHRRIGTAARWYLGMPQIFLRDSGRGQECNARIIERRLIQFLEGDFGILLHKWRADRDKAQRKAKPRKPQTVQDRARKSNLILSRWLWERGKKGGASLQKQARARNARLL